MVDPAEVRRDLWHQRIRIPGLSLGVDCVILGFAVLVELRLVTDERTDGRTDRQTYDDSIYRASMASRGKNLTKMVNEFLIQNAIRTPRSAQSQYNIVCVQCRTLITTNPTDPGRWVIRSWIGVVQNQDRA